MMTLYLSQHLYDYMQLCSRKLLASSKHFSTKATDQISEYQLHFRKAQLFFLLHGQQHGWKMDDLTVLYISSLDLTQTHIKMKQFNYEKVLQISAEPEYQALDVILKQSTHSSDMRLELGNIVGHFNQQILKTWLFLYESSDSDSTTTITISYLCKSVYL